MCQSTWREERGLVMLKYLGHGSSFEGASRLTSLQFW